MELDSAVVTALIAREYGIAAVTIAKGARGWVGETFVVGAADGRQYFAKVFRAVDNERAPDSSLQVLEELRAWRVDSVSFPVRSKGGELAVLLDGRRTVLFEFISGHVGRDGFSFEQYVDLLARIHQADIPARLELPSEDFYLPWIEPLTSGLARVWRGEGRTEPQLGMQGLLLSYREQIEIYWHELMALAAASREAQYPPVITHGDAVEHNLLVREDGKIYIIDWDEMVLGPVERDNWFWLYERDEAADFLRFYRRTFPAYQPDLALCRFYLLRRFFEDVVGYIEEIFDRPELDEQQRLLVDMRDVWFPWLWPPMQRPGPYAE